MLASRDLLHPSSHRLLVTAAVVGLLAALLPAASSVRAVTSVFINEIHYDNTGTDAGEAIEIAGPAGTNLSGWSIVLYNGAGGAAYTTTALTGIISNQQSGMGTLSFSYPVNGIQNGSPDGIALINGATPVQFLSYEGTFVAVGGAANGMTSTDIGVSENGSEALGQSLQLTGSGNAYESFTWASPMTATFGAVNTNQTFSAAVLPVANCGAAVSTAEGFAATRTVTGSDPDGTVTSLTIVGITPSNPGTITIGATTPAGGAGGTASALVTVGSTTPPGTYSVQVRATNNDTIPQTGDCVLSVTVGDIVPIGTVQGTVSDGQDGLLHRSPFAPASGNGAGTTDVWVQGVVTQKFLSRTGAGANSRGIFLQNTLTADDNDSLTSDGVFVFMGSFPDILDLFGGAAYVPLVGDEIVLRARVTEFFFLTELSSPRFVGVVRSGVDLDAETPALLADPPAVFADANRFWERGEGMRFRVEAGAVVDHSRDVFGSTLDAETWFLAPDNDLLERADPYERRIFRDPHPLDDIDSGVLFDNGNGARIMVGSHGVKAALNDNTALTAPARQFDLLNADLVGGLYFSFGKYGVETTTDLDLSTGTDPAANAPPNPIAPGEEFSTNDYNVENLYDFRDDPFDGCDFAGNAGCPGVSPPFDYVPASAVVYQQHLDDLAAQIVGALHSPALLFIQEAEDQDICFVSGSALDCDDGVNDADGKPDTLQELALTIADLGGPIYDAAYDRDGADDRGIVSAFLYRTNIVELVPAAAADAVLGDAPTVDYRGDPLAYNTDVSNPKALNADLPDDVCLATGFDGTNVYTRPPQVGHFRIWRDGIGTSVFTELWALSNHFSSTPNARTGQRTEQALYNAAIFEAILAADPDARFITGGDFNVYPRPDDPFAPGETYGCGVGPSDQLGPLHDAGLNNLWDTLVEDVPASAYSYVFQGQAQTLDMQWANDAQFTDLVEIRAAHVNADFPARYPGDVARGASDHDPQVARWFTDVTFARLADLAIYYGETGQIDRLKQAQALAARVLRAETFLEAGMIDAFNSQVEAIHDQLDDWSGSVMDEEAADAFVSEFDRLLSTL